MPVIVTMMSGEKHRLDRNLSVRDVTKAVEEGRRVGALIPLQDNRTPSRQFSLDPTRVESIVHDGHSY